MKKMWTIELKPGESLRVEVGENLAIEILANDGNVYGNAFAHDDSGEFNNASFCVSKFRPDPSIL